MAPAETPELKLDTPLMKQYQALKARHPQAVLFFRLGDFYEMFGPDAQAASPVLGLFLTHRQGLPMCGVPHHAANGHIAKLLKAGFKVAIAEQTEDPALAKGLVRREVIRVMTPGTVVEDELLEAHRSNYLAAVEWDIVGWGLACLDVSTGEFWAAQGLNDGGRGLRSLLAKMEPAEVVAAPDCLQALKLETLSRRPAVTPFEPASRGKEPSPHWPSPEQWRNKPLALRAALRAERYAAEAEPHLKARLAPSDREAQKHLELDEAAIRTLELVEASDGDPKKSLWGTLNFCRTAMGSRRLRDWILHPLMELSEIERRQRCVEELFESRERRQALAEVLSGFADLERVLSRLAVPSTSPRDLAALRNALAKAPRLLEWSRGPRLLEALSGQLGDLEELAPRLSALSSSLARALAEEPPARLSDGGVLREGYSPELDELRRLKRESREWLAALEARERERTGIPTLKVSYNSVFGYYIEVTKAHLSKVPSDYVRKQTLVNAERFFLPELKDMEGKILGSEERALRLEAELFGALKTEALACAGDLLSYARIVSALDVLFALAEAADRHDYVKPRVDLSHELSIEEGRHPMVERFLPSGTFVANSLGLNESNPRILLLTGPNMAGKSTYLRQNALIAIMAQLGGFVPARAARLGLVDRVLTRIGSQDSLARGESTFMVEMKETAFILQSATPRSLLILDEVGRGTSTYDGISIARAVLEHLAGRGPKVLFATHYFELTELAGRLPGVKNANVVVKEWVNGQGKTEVVFLHKIADGPADRSYGIHVAELAGLPPAVIARAKAILEELERGPRRDPEPEPLLPIFQDHPVLDELRLSVPEKMTPLEALQKVADWKRKV